MIPQMPNSHVSFEQFRELLKQMKMNPDLNHPENLTNRLMLEELRKQIPYFVQVSPLLNMIVKQTEPSNQSVMRKIWTHTMNTLGKSFRTQPERLVELEDMILSKPHKVYEHIQDLGELTKDEILLLIGYIKIGELNLKGIFPELDVEYIKLIEHHIKQGNLTETTLFLQNASSGKTDEKEVLFLISTLENPYNQQFTGVLNDPKTILTHCFSLSASTNILNEIPIERVLCLASLIYKFKDQLSEEEFAQYQTDLPVYAKDYLRILSNNSENQFIEIGEFLRSTTSDFRYPALAHFVNVKEIKLSDLLRFNCITGGQLLELAPFLYHVDARGIDTHELKELLARAQKLKVLAINDHSITSLPPLPNCHTLDCHLCPALTSLPDLPNCHTLNCHYCSALTSLPELPNCHTLDCCLCPALTSLPQLPNCQKLCCSFCTGLRSLPDLPNCHTLDCHHCPNLTSLQELTKCHTLYCSSCPRLTSLPQLPNCHKLDCHYCPNLTSLPQLPNCLILDCRLCTALISLPDLPNCLILDCSSCLCLTNLPLLPNCHTLDCSNCPRLEQPTSTPVRFNIFEVDLEEFKQNPRLNLQSLTDFITGNSFPKVNYIHSEGVDAGGMRRDFVTRLFDLLFLKMSNQETGLPVVKGENGNIWPNSETGNEELKNCHQIIGKILACCYLEDSHLKTGEIFDPTFFKMLQLPETEESKILSMIILNGLPEAMTRIAAHNGEDTLADLDDDLLKNATYLITPEGIENPREYFSIPASREVFRNACLQLANEDGRITAVNTISRAMKQSLTSSEWEALCLLNPLILQSRIQGELSAEKLIEKLNWEPARGTALEPTENYLTSWILAASKKQLEDFVMAVTGNKTLSAHNLKIELFNRGEDYIPSAHTCFFSLELSAEYPNQEAFNAKLNLFLAEGLAGSGFQFA